MSSKKSRLISSRIIAYCYDKKGNLLSSASNSFTKTHPAQAYYAKRAGQINRIFLHAEIAAILKASKTKKDIYRIEVVRKGKNGELLRSMPCPVCKEAIKAIGIKHITYTE